MGFWQSKCRSCGARLIWIKTASGKNMPCDYEPVKFRYNFLSNIRLVTKEGEITGADIVRSANESYDAIGYFPHWATCSNPEKFKKRGKNDSKTTYK